MLDLTFKKSVVSKSGRHAILRYLQLSDVDSVLDYVNKLGAEDTFVAINPVTTFEGELDYLASCIKRMYWGKQINMGIFDGSTCLGEADITVGGMRREHTGTLGISIAKEVRSDGFGSILMEEMLRQASEILHLKMIRLSCFRINTIALKLYKQFGFEEIGVVPNSLYYRGKYVDEVLMFKELR